MKASQLLKVDIEGIVNIVRFDNLSPKLYPLVSKLEEVGDKFGPVIEVYNGQQCIMLSYADKHRGPVKKTIFGFDQDEFMSRQYKD